MLPPFRRRFCSLRLRRQKLKVETHCWKWRWCTVDYDSQQRSEIMPMIHCTVSHCEISIFFMLLKTECKHSTDWLCFSAFSQMEIASTFSSVKMITCGYSIKIFPESWLQECCEKGWSLHSNMILVETTFNIIIVLKIKVFRQKFILINFSKSSSSNTHLGCITKKLKFSTETKGTWHKSIFLFSVWWSSQPVKLIDPAFSRNLRGSIGTTPHSLHHSCRVLRR